MIKIENKFVKIDNGKKSFTKKNHIFDNYLSNFSERQYQPNESNANLELKELFIKFDSQITNPQQSESYELMLNGIVHYDYSQNYVKTNYSYKTSDLSNINIDLSEYIGHKIYNLGFGTQNFGGTGHTIYAYLDVSDYDLYLTDEGFLDILREDLISSDAICNKIPYHLSPFLDNKIGYIHSVGFGGLSDKIEEEYIIGEDVELVPTINGFEFTFGGITDYTMYPQDDLYPAEDKFPTSLTVISTEITPQDDLYPSEDIYPLITNYKYIIFKYKIYDCSDLNDIKSTNEYYLMAYSHTKRGIVTINTKYERSDV